MILSKNRIVPDPIPGVHPIAEPTNWDREAIESQKLK
jgi:hypothetical protein